MTLTDAERSGALFLMVRSGAFPDDAALARWSVTAEAEPHLRRWLADAHKPLPLREEDIDLDAAALEIAEQDALAADIRERFTPTEDKAADFQTIMDMYELGWFGQGAAFWRWAETPAAKPYIAVCSEMRRAPEPGELFDAFGPVDDATRVVDDPDLLAQLASWIEDTYGEPPAPSDRKQS